MFLLFFKIHYVRDVGVAGSNPVTPTIDFIQYFRSWHLAGSSSGKRLWVNLRIGYLEALSAAEMLGYLDDLRADIETTSRNAIVQIECHGSDDATGLILADGSYLGWDELKPKLEAINIASRFNLVLVLGCCYGGYFGQTTRLQERAAFCVYLGPNSSLSAGMLYDGLRAFYIGLLIERDMTAAINAMVSAVPTMPYFFATAEGLFHLGFAAYIRDLASGDPLIQRAEALVQLLAEAQTDPMPTIEDMVNAIKERERPEFERAEHNHRHTEFADRVGQVRGEPTRLKVQRRRQGEDVRILTFAPQRHVGPGDEECSPQIDLLQQVKPFHVDIQRAREIDRRCVVYADIDTTKVCGSGGNSCFNGIRVTDVQLNRQCNATCRFDRFRGTENSARQFGVRLNGLRGNCDIGTIAGSPQRNGKSYAST